MFFPVGRRAVAAGLACTVLVAAAVLLAQVLDPAPPPIDADPGVRGWYRAVMCIGLGVVLAVWVPWVRRRCSDVYIARNLSWAAALLASWLVLVLVKYETTSPIASSLMWYLYYIPMLAVPTLGLFSLVRAAAVDELPVIRVARHVVAVVDVALVLLVLTNNAHHLVFSFGFEDPAWSADYRYGPGYWMIAGWVVLQLVAFLALAYVAASCRLRSLLALIAAIMGVGLAYGAFYALGVEAVRSTNLALVYSSVMLAAFETCLGVGIFPSCRAWAEAFSCLPLDLKVVDRAGGVAFATGCALPLDPAVHAALARFDASPGVARLRFRVPGHAHRVFTTYRLTGGTALLTEDVAHLDARRAQLEARRAELREYNALLERSLGVQMRLHAQRAERELEEEVEHALASALERMTVLLDKLSDSDARGSEREKVALEIDGGVHAHAAARAARFAELRLLLAYCKRKGALVLREQEGADCDAAYVALMARELECDLRAAGVVCGVVTELAAPVSPGVASILTDCLYACALAAVGCVSPVAMLVVREGTRGSIELRASIEVGEERVGVDGATPAVPAGERGNTEASGPQHFSQTVDRLSGLDAVSLEEILAARAHDVAVEGDVLTLCARACIERGCP